MTVTTETNRVSYSGDDSTVDFTVPFYFLLDTSIEVTLVDSDDAETTLVLDTDYTVTDAGVLTGGEITATTAPATGETLVIIRSEALTQTTDYIENDDFPAASHERALDKAMMINQQQQEEIARCITAPVGDDGTTDYTLPIYSASKFLQWHPTSKMLRNAELTATGTATVGTDTGDLVQLVEVSSGVAGWPALALDNMTYSGSTVGDSVIYSTGTASGAIPLNSDLGTASTKDTGTTSGTVVLNENIGTAATKDHGTASGAIPLNSDLSYTDITLATPQVTTSGSSIDFTSIPEGTKRITVMLKGVSTSGTDDILIQLGDAGGIESSGYAGAYTYVAAAGNIAANSTAGAIIYTAAASIQHGSIVLTLENATTFSWVVAGVASISNAAASCVTGSSKSLSAELDRIRITTVGGTDTFDLGEINISYE